MSGCSRCGRTSCSCSAMEAARTAAADAKALDAFVHAGRRTPETVRADVLRTIPGVTTLTQLSVAAAPLVIAFGPLRRRDMVALVSSIFVLALIRSFIFSERLALLELVVPVAYLAIGRRIVLVPRTVLVANNVSATKVTARFFGYYLTSENNALVVADRYRGDAVRLHGRDVLAVPARGQRARRPRAARRHGVPSLPRRLPLGPADVLARGVSGERPQLPIQRVDDARLLASTAVRKFGW
jgi:hypothetical protein